MKKRVVTGLLAAMLFSVSIIPNSVFAEGEDNKCGEALYWSLKDGVLTITGQGEMYDWCEDPDVDEEGNYQTPSYAPWYDQMDEISSVVVEDGVTSIGDEFLKFAYTVESVSIPDSVTSIGSYAFCGTSITEMHLSDEVESVGECAFLMCEFLKDVTVGSGMTEISEGMLADCPSLTRIDLPENITKIGSGAFSNCDSLSTLTMTDAVTEIGSYAFFRDVNLTDFTLSQSITKIEEYTFSGCGFKELTIPDGVTEIGKYAIGDSAIETLVIPDSVDIIRAYGLSSPTYLKEVIFLGHAPKSMYAFLFKDNVINAYYPVNESSWTASKKGQYSGTVTWIPLECREGHSFVESYTAPTFHEEGKIVTTCSVCGESMTETLPKLSTELTISTSKGNAANKIRFTGSLTSYDERVSYDAIVEHGILYIQKTKLGAKTLTTTTSGRTKVSFTSYKADGSFVYTVGASSATTKYVARSYMIVKDENGKQLTYYSPECVVSYSSL